MLFGGSCATIFLSYFLLEKDIISDFSKQEPCACLSSGINYKLTDKSLTFLGSIINLLYHSLMFVLSLWLRKLLHYYLWKNSMGLTLIKLEFYFYISKQLFGI